MRFGKVLNYSFVKIWAIYICKSFKNLQFVKQKMDDEYWDPKIELMSRRELELLQFKRLKWQLERCYKYSSFYRAKFKKANIHPDDIKKLEDIRKIPFVYKGELREEQRVFSYSRYLVTKAKIVEAYPTSGTTGDPVFNFWTDMDREYITDVTARTLWSMGLRPDHVVQNAYRYEAWAVGITVHRAVQKIGGFVLPVGDGKVLRQIEFLLKMSPNVILSTPTLALKIGNKLRELGYGPEDLSLEFGAFGGEPGASIPSTRKKIERLLGIDAYDYYGLMEIAPTFASECKEKAGLHWSEDYHLVEVVDIKTGEPVSEGEKGVLVITHLVKEATPMIRYWTGDIAKLEYERCSCGRTHARSPGGIIGRTDDMVIYQGVSFYPSEIQNILDMFPEVGDEYRIFLDGGKCVVEFELNSHVTDKDKKTIEKKVSEYLSDYFGVQILCRAKSKRDK